MQLDCHYLNEWKIMNTGVNKRTAMIHPLREVRNSETTNSLKRAVVVNAQT